MTLFKKRAKEPVIFYTLIGLLLFFVGMHIVSVILNNHASGTLLELAPKFDLDNEFNAPTVYSGVLWGVCAFMALTLVSRATQLQDRVRWGFLSLFFFYISFDEQMVIHEGFAAPIRSFLSISQDSILYHAWVVPAIVFTLLIGLLWVGIRGVSKISKAQREIFKYVVILGAGVIFFEAIGTLIYVSPMAYKLGPVLLEETFEMGMATLILYRLYRIRQL